MGARSTQVLPAANEVDDAIERVRKIFELQKVCKAHLGRFKSHCWLKITVQWLPLCALNSFCRPASMHNVYVVFCLLPKGAAADRFLGSLSGFINGLDTKNNVKVRRPQGGPHVRPLKPL